MYFMETHIIYIILALLVVLPFVMSNSAMLKLYAGVGTIAVSWLCLSIIDSDTTVSQRDMVFAVTASIMIVSLFYGTIAGRMVVLKQDIAAKPLYAQISLTMLASIICTAVIAGISSAAYMIVA
jgi:hypothetical protein